MFKTIIVGCDGSPESNEALELAQRLRDRDGELILTCVQPFFRGFADPLAPTLYAGILRDEARRKLTAAARRVEHGVPIRREVVADSSTPQALDDLAESERADLIVLGPSHHGALGRATARTTVQRLLHDAPCAVAVAAPGNRDLRRIVVAYDGSDEARAALQHAYALAERLGSHVRIVRVLEPMAFAAGPMTAAYDPASEMRIEAGAERSLLEAAEMAPDSVSVDRRLLTGPVARAILRASSDADLIVAGSRRRGPVRRAIAGSVSAPLLTDGTVPVLVVPRPASRFVRGSEAAEQHLNTG